MSVLTAARAEARFASRVAALWVGFDESVLAGVAVLAALVSVCDCDPDEREGRVLVGLVAVVFEAFVVLGLVVDVGLVPGALLAGAVVLAGVVVVAAGVVVVVAAGVVVLGAAGLLAGVEPPAGCDALALALAETSVV